LSRRFIQNLMTSSVNEVPVYSERRSADLR
jgi:hypothetical protein